MGDDNDQYEEQDENCQHYGVECELPCACRCNDCIDNEDMDIEEDDEMDPNPGGPDVW